MTTMRGYFDWVQVRKQPPAIDQKTVDRFLAIGDLSATVADALDELGINSSVGSSTLQPTLPDRRVVGRAITLRHVPQRRDHYLNAQTNEWLTAEIFAIDVAEPGDVLVISGMPGVSNLGGLAAALAHRGGVVGAVIDGAVRDVGQSRRLGYPIWSRDVSPVTGKWRGTSVEINADVSVAGVTASAGDLVVADETGVCFVPSDAIDAVLRRTEEIDRAEEALFKEIEGGLSVSDLARRVYKNIE